MKRVTLQVDGMHCGHCVHTVTEALGGVPGVRVEQVDIGKATVQIDEAKASVGALIDAVYDVGYEATEAGA